MKRTLPLGKAKSVRFALSHSVTDSIQTRNEDKDEKTHRMRQNLTRTVLGVVISRLGLIFVLLLALSVVMFILYGDPGGILFSREKDDGTATSTSSTSKGKDQNDDGHADKQNGKVDQDRSIVETEKLDKNKKQLKDNKQLKTDNIETYPRSSQSTDSIPIIKQDVKSDKYHVLLQLVNADPGSKFELNFHNCIKSILSKTSLNLTIHVTCDPKSQLVAENVFKKVTENSRHVLRRVYYDVDTLNEKLYKITKPLQELFSSGQGAYYSHALFFIPVALHKVLPEEITKMVMLDTDLQFRTDIGKLFALFNQMSATNIMALAREQQPIYRHVLDMYRNKYPGTKLGGPPPDGYTGFNSGVKLINLKAMRASNLYNSILTNKTRIKILADKYMFKGHLGDQDFFSLISFENPELFHVLPCSWNRQLCTYWRDNGYKDIFDQYHKCDPPIHVYHGNCDSSIPEEI